MEKVGKEDEKLGTEVELCITEDSLLCIVTVPPGVEIGWQQVGLGWAITFTNMYSTKSTHLLNLEAR